MWNACEFVVSSRQNPGCRIVGSRKHFVRPIHPALCRRIDRKHPNPFDMTHPQVPATGEAYKSPTGSAAAATPSLGRRKQPEVRFCFGSYVARVRIFFALSVSLYLSLEIVFCQ